MEVPVLALVVLLPGCGPMSGATPIPPSSTPTADTGTAVPGGDTGSAGDTGTPPCALYGSFLVANALDVSALAGTCEITGDLEIVAVGLGTAALPALERVGGSLSVHHNVDIEVELPALAAVDGGIELSDNEGDLTVVLPALASTASISVQHDERLDLRADALAAVERLGIDAGSGTLTASFASLASADEVLLRLVDGGSTLDLPALTDATTVRIAHPSEPPALDALARVEELTVSDVGTAPVAWTLPALEDVGTLTYANDAWPPGLPALDLTLPALRTAGEITIADYWEVALDAPLLETADRIDAGWPWPDVLSVSLPALREAGTLFLMTTERGGLLELPALEVVHDSLQSPTGLSAPALTAIEGLTPPDFPGYGLYLVPCAGAGVDLPALASLGGPYLAMIEVLDCGTDGWTHIDLAALPSVDALVVNALAGADLQAPTLASAGTLTLVGTDATSDLSALSAVTTELSVSGGATTELPSLAEIAGNLRLIAPGTGLSALRSVSGQVTLQGSGAVELTGLESAGALMIGYGTWIERVHLPALATITGWMTIARNTALTEVDLPALALVDGDVDIDENPVWCLSAAQALLAGITTITGTVTVDASGADPGC